MLHQHCQLYAAPHLTNKLFNRHPPTSCTSYSMVAKHHLLMLLLASAAALAHAGITLTPNKLSKNGEEIIVSWSDIPTVGNRADPDNQMNADQIVMLQSDAPDLASKWPIK